VTTPVFVLSAQEDHIAPWRNTYAAAHLYAGPVRFVLAGSGHIAGVINPAGSTKYGYRINDNLEGNADARFEKSTQHPGSWWPEWAR
jgi:polyhydroxyalkanoate synthase